jgi:hypothetical protein
VLCWKSFKCCSTFHPSATTIGLSPLSIHLQTKHLCYVCIIYVDMPEINHNVLYKIYATATIKTCKIFLNKFSAFQYTSSNSESASVYQQNKMHRFLHMFTSGKLVAF